LEGLTKEGDNAVSFTIIHTAPMRFIIEWALWQASQLTAM